MNRSVVDRNLRGLELSKNVNFITVDGMFVISLDYQGHAIIETLVMLDVNIKVITRELRMSTPK